MILEEGKPPYPWCPLCDIFVPWKALNGKHRRTSQYKRGAERQLRLLPAEEEREVTARAFSAYGRPLEMVTSFRYKERVILVADNDWPEVVNNLYQA